MKITKAQLKQIIKEELQLLLQESPELLEEGFFSSPEDKEKQKRERAIKQAQASLGKAEKTVQRFGQFDKLEEKDFQKPPSGVPIPPDRLPNVKNLAQFAMTVKDLVDEAFLNKSLGFKPEVGVGYLKKVAEALKTLGGEE